MPVTALRYFQGDCKGGYVFLTVDASELPHAKFGPNDHKEESGRRTQKKIKQFEKRMQSGGFSFEIRSL